MRILPLVAIASLLASATGYAQAPPATKYTLEDLKALAESGSWYELLEHAEDVRPSERQQPWKDLLEKAAVGTVGSLVEQKKNQEALAASEGILARFAALKQSKGFMAKRKDAGLAAFGECFTDAYSGNRCIDELDKFAKQDAGDAGLQFAAGKLVTDKGRFWTAAPPFFARAFEQPAQRKTGCKDESVVHSTLRALGQPADYDTAKAAATVAFDQCFDDMKDKLLAAFYASGGYESQNLCAGFAKKKLKLTPFQTAYCQDQVKK